MGMTTHGAAEGAIPEGGHDQKDQELCRQQCVEDHHQRHVHQQVDLWDYRVRGCLGTPRNYE